MEESPPGGDWDSHRVIQKQRIGPVVLRRWNVAMALVHLAVAVAIFVLSGTNTSFRTFSVPMRVTSLELIQPFGNETGEYLDSVQRDIGNFRLAPVTGVFSLLSAIFHALVALPGIVDIYNRSIQQGYNYFRWVEYSLSASVMIFLIAIFFGQYDVVTLLLIAALNAGCMLCGALMEQLNQYTEKVIWTPFYLGCFLEFFAFMAIYVCLFSGGVGSGAPAFVYAILATQTIGFAAFAVNMALQYARVGPWKDYSIGELTYMWLSLTFKVLLAFLVFGGLNQPNQYAET